MYICAERGRVGNPERSGCKKKVCGGVMCSVGNKQDGRAGFVWSSVSGRGGIQEILKEHPTDGVCVRIVLALIRVPCVTRYGLENIKRSLNILTKTHGK